MSQRGRIKSQDEAEILIESRRRCCLCVRLENIRTVRPLQIAHIDRDPTNSRKSNLVALCLEHHNAYDTVSRQAKGLSQAELIAYKESWLFEAKTLYPLPGRMPISPPTDRGLAKMISSFPYFRVLRVFDGREVQHQVLSMQLVKSHLTVMCADWTSIGPLRGLHFVGSFKYYRGESAKDVGTHELSWNGREFVGGLQFDHAPWACSNLIWRPEKAGIASSIT
jgi:hypothetical protein